jgi:hypothetical protein
VRDAGAVQGRYARAVDDTFTFNDMDDGDEATVIVRAVRGGVGLTLSKKADGDVEVFIPSVIAAKSRPPSAQLPLDPKLGGHCWTLGQITALLPGAPSQSGRIAQLRTPSDKAERAGQRTARRLRC